MKLKSNKTYIKRNGKEAQIKYDPKFDCFEDVNNNRLYFPDGKVRRYSKTIHDIVKIKN